VIPANNEGQLYFKFLGDGAVKPWVHLYYHDYDTVNVYAVNLNGTNEYAYKTSPSNLNFGDSSATILTWFNISAVNTEPRIISNRIINAGYEIYLQNDSSFNVFIGGASYRTIKVNGAKPTIGSWVLGALVLDQANDSVRVHFIDNSVMYENKDTNTYVINPSSTLAIGRYSSASQNFFDGKIGETQIITGKALTRAEIMAAYTQTLNGEHFDASYSGGTIVAWYKWSGDNDTGFLDDTSPTLGGNDLTGVNVDKAGDQVIINGGYK
jgi:hypothetical protein